MGNIVDTTLFYSILPKLIYACRLTLLIAFFSTIIGLVGGTCLALVQRTSFKLFSWGITSLIMVIQGTPMIVQIVFFYYGLKLPFSPLVVAIIAIGINSSAYISQVILSGINAVPKGQIEAAMTLGVSQFQTTRYIILPQAVRTVLPALGNEFATLIKDSSLAYIVGVNELFKQSRTIMSSTYDVVTVYIATALLYFIMTSLISLCIKYWEKKWSKTC